MDSKFTDFKMKGVFNKSRQARCFSDATVLDGINVTPV
jgi:hypothetical protein